MPYQAHIMFQEVDCCGSLCGSGSLVILSFPSPSPPIIALLFEPRLFLSPHPYSVLVSDIHPCLLLSTYRPATLLWTWQVRMATKRSSHCCSSLPFEEAPSLMVTRQYSWQDTGGGMTVLCWFMKGEAHHERPASDRLPSQVSRDTAAPARDISVIAYL